MSGLPWFDEQGLRCTWAYPCLPAAMSDACVDNAQNANSFAAIQWGPLCCFFVHVDRPQVWTWLHVYSGKSWRQPYHSCKNNCTCAFHCVHRVFGNSGFRDAQRQVMEAAVSGRDCFVLMPT
eukprot:scaffold44991_cov17-Tisochrysis_lutea.AAC.1